MFVQWQNCTLGGQDVSYETQSKSVFRIKESVKILKIQIMTFRKLTQKNKTGILRQIKNTIIKHTEMIFDVIV